MTVSPTPALASPVATALPSPAATATGFVVPSPSPFQFAAPPELVVWPYLLQLAVFTVLLAVGAFFALRYLREKFPALQLGLGLQSATGLKVVDRVAVDPKRTVFIVSLGKRHWLLAATDQHVTTIAELGPEDLKGEFANMVEKETQRRDTP